jgi:hypothetical protein
MKIFENHKFNWKGKTIVFFAIVIVTGIPWITQYSGSIMSLDQMDLNQLTLMV